MIRATTVLRCLAGTVLLLLSSIVAAQTNSVRGYVRSDKINSVVYRGNDWKIYELWLAPGGSWTLGGPSNLAGSPVSTSGPAPYVRKEFSGSLSTNSIVYVGPNGEIMELYLRPNEGVWHWGNLSAITGAPPASTLAPAAYTRYDVGGNPMWTIMYQAQSNGHIIEIDGSQYGTNWWMQDVTQLANSPVATSSPAPFNYWTGRQDVAYRGPGGHIYYLSKVWNGSWQTTDLSAAPVNAPVAASDTPAARKRPDDVASIVYRGTNSHIYEIYNFSGAAPWYAGDLTLLTSAPNANSGPCSYVRADNTYAVLYNANGHVIELHLAANGWEKHDLSALTNAPTAASKPSAYVRSDGINAVVYRGSNGHIYELWSTGGNTWSVGDLTAIAGS